MSGVETPPPLASGALGSSGHPSEGEGRYGATHCRGYQNEAIGCATAASTCSVPE